MATKKVNYKEKQDSELQKAFAEKKEELRKIRFGSAGARARDTKRSSNLKKEVARIMTEINARRLNIE